MALALTLLAAVSCSSSAVTLELAKALVLAAPNIEAAVQQNQAKPFFEWVGEASGGWRFTVNSKTPCEGGTACSALLGHYFVDRSTGEVFDLDAAGGEGAPASSAKMERLRTEHRASRCRS